MHPHHVIVLMCVSFCRHTEGQHFLLLYQSEKANGDARYIFWGKANKQTRACAGTINMEAVIEMGSSGLCVHSPLCSVLLSWNSLVTGFLAGAVMEAGNCRTVAESRHWLCDWDCMFLSCDNSTEKKNQN